MWTSPYIQREAEPRRGLMAAEWVMVAYLVYTLLLIALLWPRIQQPVPLLTMRVLMLTATLCVWALYRYYPCRITLLARVIMQIVLLSWWYPDTYELNKWLPNHDPLFASCDQWLFGYQPALLFSQQMPQAWFSELMHLGYASYYPLIVVVTLYYFFCRYASFTRATFVVLASFFAYYVVFVLVPVTGPQYYYMAVGTEQVATGVFPAVGDWFVSHSEALPLPGWSDGVFRQLVDFAHASGERPTAAFPSSHVGITTILLLLAWRGSRRLFWSVMPFYVLMCMATVYIQAHYAVDVIGGWLSGVAFYLLLNAAYSSIAGSASGSAKRS